MKIGTEEQKNHDILSVVAQYNSVLTNKMPSIGKKVN